MPYRETQYKPKEKSIDVIEREKNITFSIKVAGQDQLFETDDVLTSLRALSFDVNKIKTMTVFEITYKGKTYTKFLKIPHMKMILMNDMRKQIFAKIINQSLGITQQHV